MHAAAADPMRPLRKECPVIATSKVQVNHSPWSLENSPPRRQHSVASVGGEDPGFRAQEAEKSLSEGYK